MSFIQIIVLALVQGLTEFLPVSSSAHLILAPHVLSWNDQGLVLDVATHLGTLLAVLYYFRTDVLRLLQAALGSAEKSDRNLFRLLLLASIPALLIGYLFAEWIGHALRDPRIIAVTTLLFGVLLWFADRYGKQDKLLTTLNWRDALGIGLMQVLALIPGTSRSGITMTMARALGYSRVASARFSFLLAIPVLTGAACYGALQLIDQSSKVDASAFALAAGLSALVALACIALFLRLIERVGFTPFVIYRIALGIVLLWVFF